MAILSRSLIRPIILRSLAGPLDKIFNTPSERAVNGRKSAKLVAPAGSKWQHRREIERNGWQGFDFGFEVGPSNFGWLELIDSIDSWARRGAQLEKLRDTKSGKNGRGDRARTADLPAAGRLAGVTPRLCECV